MIPTIQERQEPQERAFLLHHHLQHLVLERPVHQVRARLDPLHLPQIPLQWAVSFKCQPTPKFLGLEEYRIKTGLAWITLQAQEEPFCPQCIDLFPVDPQPRIGTIGS